MEQLPLKEKVSYLEMNNQEMKEAFRVMNEGAPTLRNALWRSEEDLVSPSAAQPDVVLILMDWRQLLPGSQACSKINQFSGINNNKYLYLLSGIVCFNL